MNRLPMLALVLILAAGVGWSPPVDAQEAAKPKGAVSFNQGFVEGLYFTVKLDDEMAVFAHVFNALPDKVVVYPTENYFYWSFNANARVIWGNFRFDAGDRDKGILHLGYFEYDENGKFQDYDGWEMAITAKDGVTLKKVSRFVYSVTYKGRTVTFELNDIGMAPPKKAKLAPGEIYVGPVFDESGVKFFLIFSKPVNHFIYVVNEDGAPPETFKALKDGHTVIGRRTGFAYYLDKPNTRKILIAVNSANARRNNYYDGPFDQLPDNYADQTNIKKYLELAYPHIKGKINKYGVLKDEKGNRVAIGSYHIYTSEDQLAFVESCRKTHKPTTAKFYACITPDGG